METYDGSVPIGGTSYKRRPSFRAFNPATSKTLPTEISLSMPDELLPELGESQPHATLAGGSQ